MRRPSKFPRSSIEGSGTRGADKRAPAPRRARRRIRESAHGERAAELFAEHQGALFAVAISIVGDHGGEMSAEDVLQDAWIQVATRVRTLPACEQEALKVLATIVRNQARNRRRREKTRTCEPLETVGEDRPVRSHEGPVIAWLETQRVLARLTPAERDVVVLRYEEGFTLSEIAKRRGGSAFSAKNLLQRARRKLRAREGRGVRRV